MFSEVDLNDALANHVSLFVSNDNQNPRSLNKTGAVR